MISRFIGFICAIFAPRISAASPLSREMPQLNPLTSRNQRRFNPFGALEPISKILPSSFERGNALCGFASRSKIHHISSVRRNNRAHHLARYTRSLFMKWVLSFALIQGLFLFLTAFPLHAPVAWRVSHSDSGRLLRRSSGSACAGFAGLSG